MKLTLINGSPRGRGGNTYVLLDRFCKGFLSGGNNAIDLHYLRGKADYPAIASSILQSDCTLLAFPLYTDSMPGIVMAFIESIESLQGKLGWKKMGFFVHSGFPEGIHSSFVAKYCERLTERLGAEYLGTIIKGGSEGIQIQPDSMTKKLYEMVYALGSSFGKSGVFDKTIMERLKQPYRLSKPILLLLFVAKLIGFLDFYWKMKLKEHDAYEKRYDRPYAS